MNVHSAKDSDVRPAYLPAIPVRIYVRTRPYFVSNVKGQRNIRIVKDVMVHITARNIEM